MSGDYFERFKLTLLACLVTGYNGKASAGWTLYHDVPGSGFSLRNANGRIVNFVKNTSGGAYYPGATVYLVEGPTDKSTGKLAADLVRSGAGAPSTSPQLINLMLPFGDPSYGSYSSIDWTILADDRTFIFYAMSYSWGYNDNLPWPLLYVGEDSAGNFLSIGGMNTTTMSNVQGRFSGAGFTYLRHPLTGLVISGTEPNLGTVGLLDGGTRTAYTDRVGELQLAQVQVLTGTEVFSKLRGIVQDFSRQSWSWGNLLGALGLSASADSRGKPVVIDGVQVACVNASLSYGPVLFISADPAYW